MNQSQVIGGNPLNFQQDKTPEVVGSSVMTAPEQQATAQWFVAMQQQELRNRAAEEAAQAISQPRTIDASMLRSRQDDQQIVSTPRESIKMLFKGANETPTSTSVDTASILPTAREQMKLEKDHNPYIAEQKMAIRSRIADIARKSKQAAQQTSSPSAAVQEATERVRANPTLANIISPSALYDKLRRFGEYIHPHEVAYVRWGIEREEAKRKQAANPIRAVGRRANGAPKHGDDQKSETFGGLGAVNAGG